jgi:hypothetical protein
MVEYVLLLFSATGGSWVDRAARAVTDDPVLLWGGAVVLVLVLGWVLKPNR